MGVGFVFGGDDGIYFRRRIFKIRRSKKSNSSVGGSGSVGAGNSMKHLELKKLVRDRVSETLIPSKCREIEAEKL